MIFFILSRHNLHLFLQKMSCIAKSYLFWFMKYSHFTYVVWCSKI